ncbi:transglycosylase SLT domain-containing protein [Acinetobacter soli]|uniref:transglycosylase SLT domain-containing protein n=1 Tax=Acinetobacter soli TaxID=487316 RepID=UPI00124F9570|nr:transglycosylase SLT domain-containing protein [Acinetobacter soli]
MATASLGRLTLDLVARTASFTEPLDQAERKTKKSTQAIVNNFKLIDVAADGLKGTVADLALVVGSTAASIFSLNKIIDVQRNFDKLNASLITATGSVNGAKQAFSILQNFAQTTPYGLEQSVTAFVKLVNLGLNPSQKALTSYGNTAAAMGKDLDQMIEAVADAATGEFERLKEFGIKASQQNGKVSLTFQGTTKTIENSSKAIQDYLLQIGDINFAGAMENRMKSLDGAFANFEDTLDSVVLKISQSGVGDFLKDSINSSSIALESLGENLETVADVSIILGSIITGKVVSGLILSTKATLGDIIASRQKILTNYEVAKSELAATAAMVRATGATNAETAALVANARATYQKASAAKQASLASGGLMTAGRGLLGVLGGPVGLGITIASVAAGFLLLKDNSRDLSESLDDQGLSVDELRVKYEKMTDSQLKLKTIDASEIIEDQTKKLNSYKSAIIQVIDELNTEGDVKQSGALQKYLNDLKSGGEAARDAFANLEKQGLVSESNLKMMANLDNKIGESNKSIEKQNQIKDLASKRTDTLTEFQKKQNTVIAEQARILGLTTAEWAKLTKQQQDYAIKVGEKSTRDVFIGAFTAKNGSKEQAEFWANQYEAMGVPLTQKLSEAQKKIAIEAWNNSDNFALKPDQIKSFNKVQGLAAQYKFSDKENSYGLPAGLLSAIMMNESRGDTFRNGKLLTSESGAQGSFQFMPNTAKRFGVDVKDIESSALGAAKYLSYLYKEFGDWNKAIAAYHAGEGNVARGTNIGPRTKGYVVNAQKYMAAANGKTTVDNSILMPTQADILAQQLTAAQSMKELDDTRKQIDAQYYTESEKLAKDHQDRIEKITQAYTGTAELKSRLAQEDVLYKEQSTQLKVQREEDYANLTAFETDRVKQLEDYYARQIELVKTSTKINEQERAKEISGLQRKRDFEIAAVRREQDEQVQSVFEAYLNETEIVVKRYQREREEILANGELLDENRKKLLQANQMDQFRTLNQASDSVFQYGQNAAQALMQRLNPEGFSRYNLQNQYSSDMSGLKDQYDNQVSGINAKADNSIFLESEATRNQELLAARDQFLQARKALEEKYAQDQTDLDQQQFETKMQVYSQIAGMVGQTFDQMTGMLKDSVGESNALYKAMFIAGKAASIAQAIVNTEEGATKALAQGGAYGSLLAGVIRATGYASVGMIAAQTITGFADGGYTGQGGKYEPAGIVHRGEVVFSQADIARLGGVGVVESMRLGHKGYADGGIVGDTKVLNVNQTRLNSDLSGQTTINVYTLPGETADVTQNSDGSLDVKIRKIIDEHVPSAMSNPSSRISKSMTQNYAIKRQR